MQTTLRGALRLDGDPGLPGAVDIRGFYRNQSRTYRLLLDTPGAVAQLVITGRIPSISTDSGNVFQKSLTTTSDLATIGRITNDGASTGILDATVTFVPGDSVDFPDRLVYQVWGVLADGRQGPGLGGAMPVGTPIPGVLPPLVAATVARVLVTAPNVTAYGIQSPACSAIVEQQDGTPITGRVKRWSVSTSPDVASIDASTGVLTVLADGTFDVLCTVDGISGEAVVTVALSTTVASITVTPNPVTLGVGQTRQLAPIAYNAGGAVIPGAPFTYAALDATHDTVSGTGLITGVLATTGAGAGVRVTSGSVYVDVPVTVNGATAQLLADYNAIDPNVQLTHVWVRNVNMTKSDSTHATRWGDAISDAVAWTPKSGFTNCLIDAQGRIVSEGLEIPAAAGMGSIPAQGLMFGLVAKAGLSNCGMLMLSNAAVGSEFTNTDGFYMLANNGVNGGTSACGFSVRPPTGSGFSSLITANNAQGTDVNPIVGFLYVKQDLTRIKVHSHRDQVDCTRAAATGVTTGNKAVRIGVSDGYPMTSGATQVDGAYRGFGNPTAAHVKILNDWAEAQFGAIAGTGDLLWPAGNSIMEQADVSQWVAGLTNITWCNHGWSGAQFDGAGLNDVRSRMPWLEGSCDFSRRRRTIFVKWEVTNTGVTPPATILGYEYAWVTALKALGTNVRVVTCTIPGIANNITTGDAYTVEYDIEQNWASHGSDQLANLWRLSPLNDPAQLTIAPYWTGIHPTLAGQQQMYATYKAAIAGAQAMA